MSQKLENSKEFEDLKLITINSLNMLLYYVRGYHLDLEQLKQVNIELRDILNKVQNKDFQKFLANNIKN
jgi:hypothetical protein